MEEKEKEQRNGKKDVIVRLADKDDIPVIMDIVRRTIAIFRSEGNPQWSDDYPAPADFEEDIRQNALYVIMVETVVGFISLGSLVSPEYVPIAWTGKRPLIIHRFSIDPDCRGRGYGSTLMRLAIALAKEEGKDAVWTDTNGTNRKMRNLFSHFGFQETGTLEYAGWSGDFVSYELVLGSSC